MLKLRFNRKAIEALAKELRRASWGIAVAIAAGAVTSGTMSSWSLLGAGFAWIVLQVLAFTLQSVASERSNRNE